jgi:hypothetical protein
MFEFENEVIIFKLFFGIMVHGQLCIGFQKIPYILVSITRH